MGTTASNTIPPPQIKSCNSDLVPFSFSFFFFRDKLQTAKSAAEDRSDVRHGILNVSYASTFGKLQTVCGEASSHFIPGRPILTVLHQYQGFSVLSAVSRPLRFDNGETMVRELPLPPSGLTVTAIFSTVLVLALSRHEHDMPDEGM